ncbi:MAG TPA: efflux RND transporter permease subunit, partial [Acidobacteriota bacterium]
MKLVRSALDNPYAVVVIVLAIIILGVTAATRIPTDLLPIFKTPAVQILTLYPGMPADVMERDNHDTTGTVDGTIQRHRAAGIKEHDRRQ